MKAKFTIITELDPTGQCDYETLMADPGAATDGHYTSRLRLTRAELRSANAKPGGKNLNDEERKYWKRSRAISGVR